MLIFFAQSRKTFAKIELIPWIAGYSLEEERVREMSVSFLNKGKDPSLSKEQLAV